MKVKIKEVARHLAHDEDVGVPALFKRQLAPKLVRSSKRWLPGALRNWITNKMFPSIPSAQNQEEARTLEELAPTASPVSEAKKTRWHCVRRPKETSNWWSQFLTESQRLVLQNDNRRSNALMLKTLF